uniref:Regulator of G-protein signaling 8 n=1 Tax=Haplochromis burtoni TaxID=8153 RepID=A0A3Q2WPH7_HAPBU
DQLLLLHQRNRKICTMKTRLGCLSHKSDSYNDFSEFLPPAHETTARYGLAAFRTFLKSEFSDENIEFWMACEDYKKIKSSAKLVSKANKIFKEFVEVQAPREINIDYRTREKTKQSLADPTPTSLNEVQGKIYSLMEKDSYPRFLRSKMYQDIVNRAQARGQRRSV